MADEVWCQNDFKIGMMVIIESGNKHKICDYSPYFQVLSFKKQIWQGGGKVTSLA